MFAAKNFLLTPPVSSGPAAPAYNSTGGPSSGSSTSLTWSHAAASGAAVLVAVSTSSSATFTVKWGSTTMTLLGSAYNDNFSIYGGTYLYGLTNAGTGSAVTVTVTASASAAMSAGSASYSGVSTFGTPVTASGATAPGSLTVSSATGHIAFCAISSYGTGPLTGFSQTQRFNTSVSGQIYIAAGDAPGASSVGFSASGGGYWAAVGVDMH